MTINFLCLFSIKRMWKLGLLARWALYFSEVVTRPEASQLKDPSIAATAVWAWGST